MKTLLRVALCAALLGLMALGATAEVTLWPGPKATPKTGLAPGGPRQTAPDLSVAEGRLVRIQAQDVPEGAALVWRVSPSAGVDKATTAEGLLEFVAPPGSYVVELLVISPKKDAAGKTLPGLSVQERSVSVTVEPAAKPIPVPPAQPAPKGGVLAPAKAIAKISFPPFGCTACPVGPRRADGRWDVLTAAHCVSHVKVGATGQMRMLDGRVFTVRVVKVNPTADYCWMVTDDATVADMPYANLAAANPPVGTAIWHAGYGVDNPGNREDGQVTGGEDGNGQLSMSLSVSSGDSGGPILRADTDEIISTVCCTRAKGAKAPVWGASANQIRAGRPGAVTLDPPCPRCPTFTWEPMEVPLLLP